MKDIMKTAQEIFSKIKELLFSPEFMEKHKICSVDFTRKRVLTFSILLLFILNGIKKSLQVQLNDFLDPLCLPLVSKQAFSDARKKISSEAFIDLNRVLSTEYYSNNSFKTYFGHVLIAIDGSTLQLPESPEIKEKYGVAINGNTEREMPMGRTVHAYDVINGITISAFLEPYKISERNIYFKLIDQLNDFKQNSSIEKILLLLDRGFPSMGTFISAISNNMDLLAGFKIDFLPKIIELMTKKNHKDKIFKFNELWLKIN